MAEDKVKGLRLLARLHGVQTEFVDNGGRLHHATTEGLLDVLKALGAPVEGPGDVDEAIRERRHALRSRRIEPVAVAWDGRPSSLLLRFPESLAASALDCRLTSEDGTEHAWRVAIADLHPMETEASPAEGLAAGRLRLSGPLPTGYHRLTVRFPDAEAGCLVISAPVRAYGGSGESEERTWGLFCPLHALHRGSSWGAGDFSDLEALINWTAGQGGGLVATLPMLASFFDGPTVSPYAPSSRLFWNEFYLDLRRIPELARSEPARALMESAEFRREVESLRSERLVEYSRQMRLKRRVLEFLADAMPAEGERHAAFRRFLRDHPEAADYASFMATVERHGHDWDRWPAGARDEVDDRARRYHFYAQWQADDQLRALSEAAGAKGLTWYVDFTVGVDPRGYDVWSRPDLFCRAASIGCPPDEEFTEAQNWRFPPLHPERQRETGYSYMIAALRNHFRHARALRLDHVMGLHRLFWLPASLGGRDGAYVTYPAEELYAILSVESHRRGAWVVGEDLGTVPPEVPEGMRRHGVRGLYVAQHEIKSAGAERPLTAVTEDVVASLNTHDLPPFAAYWAGRDIEDRVGLGLLDEAGAAEEEAARPGQRRALVAYLRRLGLLGTEDGPGDVALACYEFLAASPARVVLINPEDLWLETEAQNMPGTEVQFPNWRHKFRLDLEDFARAPAVLEALRRISARRRCTPVTASSLHSGPTAIHSRHADDSSRNREALRP